MNPSNAAITPRISQRQIREATVQLLHAGQVEGEEDGAWSLVLAHLNAKVTRFRARALLHLQQNRPSRVKGLAAEPSKVIPLLENFLDDRSAARSLRALLKTEGELPEFLDLLRRQLKSEKEVETIEETLERIRERNVTSLSAQKELIEALGPVDACPEGLAPLARALPPLLETSELLRSLFATEVPEIPETKALREALAECDLLKEKASALQALVSEHQKETDEWIASVLENFAPDRLAQVDRAVLRLAATELKHCPDVPAAVSIDEAVEVARRFGGTDSAGFVNGVLDKLKSSLGEKKA